MDNQEALLIRFFASRCDSRSSRPAALWTGSPGCQRPRQQAVRPTTFLTAIVLFAPACARKLKQRISQCDRSHFLSISMAVPRFLAIPRQREQESAIFLCFNIMGNA